MRGYIFITGAASGIGRSTAIKFAREGWFVGLYDLDEDGLKETSAHIIENYGERFCVWKKTDVTSAESMRDAFHHFAAATDDRIDVLFNNAGVLFMGPHDTIPVEQQELTIDVNFRGVLNGINEGLPMLLNNSNSRIINMSSASAIFGSGELAVYSATKFAIRGLTEALNVEMEDRKIWVCDIMAPYVSTPMIETEKKSHSLDKMGAAVTPEDVADVVWQAANGKKVHWYLKGMGALLFLEKLPWFIKRPIFKSLLVKKQK